MDSLDKLNMDDPEHVKETTWWFQRENWNTIDDLVRLKTNLPTTDEIQQRLDSWRAQAEEDNRPLQNHHSEQAELTLQLVFVIRNGLEDFIAALKKTIRRFGSPRRHAQSQARSPSQISPGHLMQQVP